VSLVAIAIVSLLLGGPTLHGTVRDARTGKPIEDAAVLGVAPAASVRATSNDRGAFRALAPPGRFSVFVVAAGHLPLTVALTDEARDSVDIALDEARESDRGSQIVGVGAALDRFGVIQSVAGGSPAADLLMLGDRVLAIDGVSTDGLTYEQAYDLFLGPEHTRCRVTVNRDGAILEILVGRRRYLEPDSDPFENASRFYP
jgi:hypothetical protein